MAVKVDVQKSQQFRVDGNTSFKKGKWADAIGHYTNAVIYNPEDPVAYCNRAQAYLKLDKYRDAERDCTTALDLPKGKGNIKALYRRGLARKGLVKLQDAIEDMKEIIRLDSKNEAVKTELKELEELKRKQDEEDKKPPRRPVTPPSIPKSSTKGSSKSLLDSNISGISGQIQKLDIQPSSEEPSTSVPAKESSFAAMRKSREEKKLSYAAGGGSPAPTVDNTEAATRAALSQIFPLSSKSSPKSTSQPKVVEIPSPAVIKTSAESSLIPPLPTGLDVTSTSPGAGLSLLRYLTSSSAYNFALLSLYPSSNIPKILGNLLEPDTLGTILLALEEGIKCGGAEGKERVKTILEGMRETKRWKMNVAMLSRNEKVALEEAWKGCGGIGACV